MENTVFKNTAVILEIIKKICKNINDPRFYELLSIDYVINEDRKLEFLNINRINKLINTDSYD